MTPARSDRNPLIAAFRLVFSRGAHLAIGVLAVAFSIFAGIDVNKERPHDGTVWLLGRPELVVLEVLDREGVEPPPLRRGDQILGIANQLVRSPQDAAALLQRQKVDSTVNYLVRRDGQNLVLPVQLAPIRVTDLKYLINVVLALIYLTIGALTYLKSRNEEPVRLFFLMCLLFTVYFMTNLTRTSYFWGDILTQNGGALARFLLPPLFLNFFLIFPEKKLVLTRHPFLAPLLFLLPVMFYIRFTLNQFFGSEGASIGTTHWLILSLYFVGGLVALLHGYFNFRDPLQKERVRILTLGTLGGVLPFLVFKIGLEEMWARYQWAELGAAPLVAIPISFGYCIARYRVMQVEFLLKRSLLYSLITGATLLGYLALVLAVGGVILQLTGPTSQLVSVGATLAIAALLWPARSRVQGIVDRKFFRTRDNLATLMEEFSREIPHLIQRDTLLQKVGSRLCDVLELPALGVYLGHGDGGDRTWRLSARVTPPSVPGVNRGRSAAPDLTDYPPGISLAATVRILERRSEPFWVEPPPTSRLENRLAITREQAEMVARFAEQEELFEAGIVLLVPLATQGRLVGLFALPAKPAGEAYRLPEIQLLTMVAGQVALQIENARLYEEEVAKQKLEEEMALARTIQSRLLPSSLPSLPGVDLGAVNISSRQVSGDYYDMILKEDGCLGIVIADVSGKGMPASLLASNLQAALRAQCDTDSSPGTILGRVNRQLHASTDPHHFATLFLCIFNPRQRTLHYSSGGHNAPILLRHHGEIELLDKGGLPLGAFEFGEYEEGEITLEQGDLLFLYTDGLTESKDPTEDLEFGEERLNELLKQNRDLAIDSLIDKVHEELKTFSGRQEADDDITLVALKIVRGDDPRTN